METDFAERDIFTERLKTLMRDRAVAGPPDRDYEEWLDRKATPEAEAYVVVRREREGIFNVLANPPERSESWFVSSTSAINAIDRGRRVTWQPESFLEFAGTLLTEIDENSADRAFDTLLWGLAESGVSPVDEATIGRVFGGVIDGANLSLPEQREAYEENLGTLYGESQEAVLARLPPSRKILAALQLKNQIIQRQAATIEVVQEQRATESRRAKEAEKALDVVARYRRKAAARQARIAKRKRTSGKKYK